MGKSLDFVKEKEALREASFEYETSKVFEYFHIRKDEEDLFHLKFETKDGKEKVEIEVKYDPEAEFEELNCAACSSGDLHRYIDLMRRNLEDIGSREYCRRKGWIEGEPAGKKVVYVIGDFIWTTDHGSSFGTKYETYLPFKREIQ